MKTMRNSRWSVPLLGLALLAGARLAAPPAHAQPPASDTAAATEADKEAASGLAVLAPLIGTWDEVVHLPEGRHFSAHGDCQWILGKAFLKAQFTIRMSDEATLERMTLYGWNRETRKIEAWIFASSGVVREATCEWDADQQTLTMRFKPTEEGVTTTSRSHFAAPDRIEWTVESRNRDNQIVFSLKGTDTKKSE